MASLFLWLLIGICGRGFEAADPVNSQRISSCPTGIRIRIDGIAFSYIFQADSTIHAETVPLRSVAAPQGLMETLFRRPVKESARTGQGIDEVPIWWQSCQ